MLCREVQRVQGASADASDSHPTPRTECDQWNDARYKLSAVVLFVMLTGCGGGSSDQINLDEQSANPLSLSLRSLGSHISLFKSFNAEQPPVTDTAMQARARSDQRVFSGSMANADRVRVNDSGYNSYPEASASDDRSKQLVVQSVSFRFRSGSNRSIGRGKTRVWLLSPATSVNVSRYLS